MSSAINSVLVVDDDETLLAAYKRCSRDDLKVVTSNDPAAAIEIARREGSDLAIIDLRLGGDSGIELVRELKQALPDLKIVLVSGYLSVATTVAAMRAGADEIMFKPTTFDEILRRVEEGSAQEPVIDEETPTLARAEWEHIMRVLDDCNGNISMAARRLGIYRSSLQRRLRKYAPRE